jgi:hypothetical protein
VLLRTGHQRHRKTVAGGGPPQSNTLNPSSMSRTDKSLGKVQALIEKQLQLLNLALFVCDKGSADFENQEFVCALSEKVRAAVVPMSLAAGQSVGTILQYIQERGIPVRDCFPVARSAVETFVNATYVLAGGDALAEKAIRHAQQKLHRGFDRSIGRGEYKIYITASPMPDIKGQPELKAALEEFTTARGREKSWTDDSVPMRIEKVGQALGVVPASGLLGAYALIYGDASEIIHGSLFGIQLFYHGRTKSLASVEDFRALTAEHLEGIFFAVFLALNSYLRAFSMSQNFSVLDRHLERIFDEFMQAIRAPDGKRV